MRAKTRRPQARRAKHKEEDEAAKARVKCLKTDADALEAKVWHLRGIVKTGKELQPVECRWSIDQETGVAKLVRQDTGEVVRTRALDPSERQTKLFALDGGRGKALS